MFDAINSDVPSDDVEHISQISFSALVCSTLGSYPDSADQEACQLCSNGFITNIVGFRGIDDCLNLASCVFLVSLDIVLLLLRSMCTDQFHFSAYC